jgi:RimJ/RimL family protein N-acetyltransferase
MPSTVTRVRRVTAADAGRAQALRLEMLADTPLAFITTLAEAAAAPHAEYAGRCAALARGDQQVLFVAEAGGRLVGQVGAYAHPHVPDRSMLFAIYITPAHRGDGTLAALVDAVAAWSRECGRATIELEVVTTNARARRAYEKLGFVAYGALVPHPTIPVMSEVRMCRPA